MLDATGAVALAGGAARLEATIEASGLDAAQVSRFWPLPLAPKARRWFAENVSGGMALRARLSATLPLPWADAAAERALDLGFAFSGLSVHFLGDLPPATEVAADARLTLSRLDLAVTDARLAELAVRVMQLAITGIDNPGGTLRLAADLPAAGPIRAALEILDQAPLRLPTKARIDPAW